MAIIERNVLSELNTVNDVTNQNENYRVRYIELTKAIAGAFLGCILCILASNTSLTGSPLIIVGTTMANIIGWLLGEQIIHRLCVYFNLYTATKSKNPLYRNFKTLASLGAPIGIILAMMLSSCIDIKFSVSIYSASAGFILGLVAFAIRYYRQSLPVVSEDKKNRYSQIGTEGWSKYCKLALTFGTSIGQSIGGYISYAGGYDAITSWTTITFYGAVVAIIGFFSVVILVPIVNYLTRNKTERGILVIEDKDVFNSGYIRTGMTLGVAIGTILGSLLGPVIFVGLSASVSIVIGTAFFSIICGIILGIYGHKLSLYLQNSWGIPIKTDNSWSYASRNTSYVFGFIGTAMACLLCPGAALLQSVAIGSAISGLVGWFVGLGVIWKARQVEPNEEKSTLPWTQRISTGATRGSIIGALFGLVLALTICTSGPLGLIGWITLSSALGGILGAVKDGVDDSAAKKLMRKIFWGESTPLMPDQSKNLPSQSLDHTVECSSISPIDTIDISQERKKEESSPNDLFLQHSFNGNIQFFSSNSMSVEEKNLRIHVDKPRRLSL